MAGSQNMDQKRNPLREWRGKRSLCWAAFVLHMSEGNYLTLEVNPNGSNIKSNRIIAIAKFTGIPLEVLIDYLTQKEMA